MMREAGIWLAIATLVLGPARLVAQETAEASASFAERDALLERATQLHRQHRLDDALEAYLTAVDVQDEANQLPEAALARIATIHLAAGRVADAARTMDRLAARAEWLGYPDVQARALLESAALYQATGSASDVRARTRRLEALLHSPHIDPDSRARIRSRLRRPAAAAAL